MVLAEAYSVIIRTHAIKTNFKGGYEAFLYNLPNKTHCSDSDELDRIGFMVWDDMMIYVKSLVENNLSLSADFTLFHMLDGPIIKADWLEWARLAWFEESIDEFTFAWLSPNYGGEEELLFAYPNDWTPEKSIKATDYTPEGELRKRFQLLKNDKGFCTYWDPLSGKVRYVGRS
ncbi:MAG: hypothetical protein HF312_02615 [Ignavibacteria bacterium]|jgi:hypothetical protein|nr:hypothetical protein [Ignavibacteria bacterium]MCU7519078.1 hypothetical protein [Ignavibacteria bacterium]